MRLLVNGKKIGNAFLTPGWTSYNKRLQYQAYDITHLMATGENVIGMNVGSGWYRTPLAWNDNKNLYGKKLGLLVQVNIIYSDDSQETVISDNSWKTTDQGPIRFSEIYNGEILDARQELPDWNKAGFDDQAWQPVTEKEYTKSNLIGTYNEPVVKHESFHPVRIFKSAKGEQIIDFGQNLVGWAQFRVQGKAGDEMIVEHAGGVLDKNGNFYTENLRAAKATDNTYIFNGKRQKSFLSLHFTFHGFRYLRVKGFPGEMKPEIYYSLCYPVFQHESIPVNLNVRIPMLNQLQHNIQWGQRGNFLDVHPRIVPQRDERLGIGRSLTAQAFSRTASFNMDVHNFFSKWMKDVAADQSEDGKVPFVVPNVLGPTAGGSAGWADVSTIIPWNMWLAYGDPKILEDQYGSMKGWVGYMQNHSTDYLWNTGFHFGDWLFYRPADDNDGRSAVTDKYLIAQCFFAHSIQLLVNAAKVLNNQNDVQKYSELLIHVKDAFLKEYMTSSGRLVSGTQTAYVLALQFDMLPDSLRAQAAKRLVNNIQDYDNHLTTGFLGTPYLCGVLTRYGYDTVAYKLLLQETYPSWLYPVKMGATTIWERWDGQKPDSSFQTPGMNSFNHYAYGAIGDWMYRNITGLDTYEDGAGYKKIRILPHTGGNLSYASAELETGYGKVSVSWKLNNGNFSMDVEIPSNTTAAIFIPTSAAASISENGKPLSDEKEIVVRGKEGNYIELQTGSGTYHFTTAAAN